MVFLEEKERGDGCILNCGRTCVNIPGVFFTTLFGIVT